MPNSFTHKFVGGLTGLGVAIALTRTEQRKEQPINPLLATGAGVAFGKLPDILEPSTNPHHRQFCHSFLVLALVGYGMKKAYDWKPEDRVGKFWKAFALCAGAAYISHLALDAFTPKSLPVIGKL